MKKILIAMAAIAATFTMASCNKEQFTESGENIKGNYIVAASTEGALTKTFLSGNDTDGYEVVWSEGDTFILGGNAFTLIQGTGTTSGTFQGNVPARNQSYTAYYPASYDGSNWPTKQTYTEEGNGITGSPMEAYAYCWMGEIYGGKVEFKNIGGILRLTVKGAAKVTSITVYTDDTPDITLDCGNGVDLNNTDGTVFHIAMPAGTHSGTSVLFTTDNGKYCIKTLKSNLVINRSEITPASIKIDKWFNISKAPEGALSGTFTVSAEGKEVFFSKGNLYWNNTSFQFESNQLSSASGWNASHVSHFYWSTDTGKARAEYYSDPDASKDDVFFTNATYTTPDPSFIANGQKGMWRTLSNDEWKYLIENNGSLWTTIDGVKGLIIFCDEYSGSRTGLTEIPEGCAFLPAAGSRNGYSGMISGAGFEGAYSSSVAGTSEGDPTPCAYGLVFGENYAMPQALNYRERYGYSVRLVTEKSGKSTPTFTVTFDMNGKPGTAPAAINVPYHTTITAKPTDPTTEGKIFWKWCKDAACTVEWDFAKDVVTSDITLYALWQVDGALFGTFTVNSSGKKVHFAKGNLYADGSKALHFEDAQWKSTPTSNGNMDASHVSHFTWSSTVADAVGYWNNGNSFFCDKNNKVSVDRGDPIYYALSRDEWTYLFNNHKFKWASVNGVNGYVIAPDGFEGTLADSYTNDSALAADDLVFLPAAGHRHGSGVDNVGDLGRYWSSTVYDSRFAHYVYFNFSIVSPDNYDFRDYGYSVRLITESKQ